jgi:hypothetical protein
MKIDKELVRDAEFRQTGANIHEVQKDIAVYTGFCNIHEKLVTKNETRQYCLLCSGYWDEKTDSCIQCGSTRNSLIGYAEKVIRERTMRLRKVAYP